MWFVELELYCLRIYKRRPLASQGLKPDCSHSLYIHWHLTSDLLGLDAQELSAKIYNNGRFFSTLGTMKNVLALTILLIFAMICISYAMDPRHTAWNGCNCQCGGERGGHCHCAWDKKLNWAHCRHGGNHWICFPFKDGGDCSRHGIFWP
ncbi:unnamed protein product [Orchesella dallaii]|uniref:Uncharacterized protein n=1 Tax=Orchesella dallaii TaxID=48710 RepID=A0ABP1R0X8_9HEXA